MAFLATLDNGPPSSPPFDPLRVLSWHAPVAVAPLALREAISLEWAIVLSDGGLVRWLGNFDLLALRNICAIPLRSEVLMARLFALGLGAQEAALLLRWAVQHGVLAETEAERETRPASPI